MKHGTALWPLLRLELITQNGEHYTATRAGRDALSEARAEGW